MAAFWADKTPEEKAAIMRDKLIATSKKRELTPQEKQRLATFKAKAKGLKKAKLTPEETRARDAARHQKLRAKKKTGEAAATNRATLTAEQRAAKQAIYVKRHTLRAQGVPEDQLPPLPKAIAAQAA